MYLLAGHISPAALIPAPTLDVSQKSRTYSRKPCVLLLPVQIVLMQQCTAMQDKIQKDFKDTPALWSMCWMNFWCSLYNCAYLFVVTTAGWDLIAFCRECPEVCFHKHTAFHAFPALQAALILALQINLGGVCSPHWPRPPYGWN